MMDGKPVRESQSEYSELALPNDANGLGNVLGGKVMHLVDLAGALAAMRHARRTVVTASVDHMSFLSPVHIGQLIMLRSRQPRVPHLHGSGGQGDGGGSAHGRALPHFVGIPDLRGAG